MAVAIADPGLVNQIVAHPRFDRRRSRADSAVFLAMMMRATAIVGALVGDDLAVRHPPGMSLLAAAVRTGDPPTMQFVRGLPGFELARQSPEQLLWAATHFMFGPALDFLAGFPEIDLNAPIPFGNNLFADGVAEKSWSDMSHVRVRRGSPILFSLCASEMFTTVLPTTARLDFNQRGKFGQTVLFEIFGVPSLAYTLASCRRIDLNLTDRHGNTALMCRVVSKSQLIVRHLIGLGCDSGVRNEVGDSEGEVANLRAKRRSCSLARRIVQAPVPQLHQFLAALTGLMS
jgi:hypothetical protein